MTVLREGTGTRWLTLAASAIVVSFFALAVLLIGGLGGGPGAEPASAIHIGGEPRVSYFGLDYLGGFGDPITIEISGSPSGQFANAHLDADPTCSTTADSNHTLTGITVDANDDPDFAVCTDTGVTSSLVLVR